MSICRLDIDGLRNLSLVSLQPGPGLNIVFGDNGSGKTSLLEAVYVAAQGRSFRGNRLSPLVQHGRSEFTLFLQLDSGDRIGLKKASDRSAQLLKFNSESQRNWQNVAAALPVQLFNADSFALLEGGGRVRRRFIDWGVFHVEHGFLDSWRNTGKLLKHRNALLKSRTASRGEIAGWDRQFIQHAERLSSFREKYFDRLSPFVNTAISELLPDFNGTIQLSFDRGWSEERGLEDLLADNLDRDLRYGATQAGPHRADIGIRHKGEPAVSVLSRGQQKLLVSAMKLAQIRLMKSFNQGDDLVLLIDDLPSELDTANARLLLAELMKTGAQAFLTCISKKDIPQLTGPTDWNTSTFHVEHGKIRKLNAAE